MQIINPLAFLLLGLIPIIIIIHSLKPKPEQVKVTNLFLWQHVIREKKGGIRIQKLIRNLPLLLQIIAVILASIALADPLWFHTSSIKGNVILVLDTTASMKTLTNQRTRFELAKEKAVSIVDEMPKDSEMLVIEAGRKPRLISDFTGNKNNLKEMISNIGPTDASGKIEDALTLAISFLDPERDDWIFPVTDGAGHSPAYFSEVHRKIKPVFFTGGDRNIGITKFEFRQELDISDRYEIMLEVKNFTNNPVLCPVELKIDNKVFIKQTVGLKGLEKRLLVFPYSGVMAGTAQAELALEDDLDIDNKAYSVLNTTEEIWVMLVTKNNFFLEKILEVYPNFMINSFDQIIPSSWKDQIKRHDIVILDRVNPPAADQGNYLLIKSFSPSIPLKYIGETENPQVLDWNRKTPVLKGLNPSGLTIESAAIVEAKKELLPIIESENTGLMYLYENKDLRAVYLGFDLAKTDLPLRIAFPVMMNNIFQWLHPEKLRFSASQIKAGTPFDIHLEPASKSFSILPPSGKWKKYEVSTNHYRYDATYKTGIYTISEGRRKKRFAVNLTDESESDILIKTADSKVGEPSLLTEPDSETVKLPLWLSFLVCAFLIMMAEWYLWLRNN